MSFQIKNGRLIKYIAEPGETKAVIPDGVTSIGYGAFADCEELREVVISKGITSIGDCAFEDCSGLKRVVMPDGLTRIGSFAFSGCAGLAELVIPNGVTSIEQYAFCGCAGLTEVVIPAGITGIGDSVFEDCTGLQSVVIPNGVTSIGGKAFSHCAGLRSVVIPNSVTSIGGFAFYGCVGLEKVVFPDGITEIGDYAFSGCTDLAEVVIPDSVTSIGRSAFFGCEALTEVVIPNSVTSIGNGAFSGCAGLRSVVIPNSVTSIGESVFSGCARLAELVLPDGITEIGDRAFCNCRRLWEVVIPDSVTSIGSSAFSGCACLKKVVIPDSVTSIGSFAFSGCTALTRVNISVQTLRGCEDETIWRCFANPEDETAMRSYCTFLGSYERGTKKASEEKLLRSSLCAAAEYFERQGRFAEYAVAHDTDPDALWDALMSREPDTDLKKLCAVRLFKAFLQKKEYTARAWREMFLPKPVPASLARLLVWQQGEVTFTLDEAGVPVSAHGHAVELTDAPIILAHPMELDEDTVRAWRNHFTAKQLTQPFIQMREPVLDGSAICPDRYEEYTIARQLLQNREKHGITIVEYPENEWYDLDNLDALGTKEDIKFPDCTADVFAVYRDGEYKYVIRNFDFMTFTRQVNHIALILDSLTARDRILKDDVSIRPYLECFDLPQILELIDLAAQNGCLQVTAMLQQYKRDRFGSADPTARFSLES